MNTIYQFLFSRSSFTRLSITLGTLLIIVITWWFFCYKTIQASIKSYSTKITYLNRQKKRYLTLHSECAGLRKAIDTVQGDFDKKTACGRDLTKALTWVIDCIRENGILLEKCSIESSKKQSWYSCIPCIFTLNGTFENFLAFVECVHTSDYFIHCSSCSIKRLNNTSLSCNLTLEFLLIQ